LGMSLVALAASSAEPSVDWSNANSGTGAAL
jgi:hypothetical protein